MISARTVLLGFVGVAAISAGTSAVTAATSMPTSITAGYGTSTVSGGKATSIAYTLSTDGSQIISVSVIMVGDLTGGGYTVTAGFDADDPLTACTPDAHVDGSGNTPFTCGAYTQSLATATDFHLSVIKNTNLNTNP